MGFLRYWHGHEYAGGDKEKVFKMFTEREIVGEKELNEMWTEKEGWKGDEAWLEEHTEGWKGNETFMKVKREELTKGRKGAGKL